MPVAGKRQFEDHADYAVVEIFDLALQALAAFQNQWFQDFFYRRTLEADVARSHVFEAGVDGAGAEDVAQLVKANLFADVELDHDQNRAAKGASGGLAATSVGRASRGLCR